MFSRIEEIAARRGYSVSSSGIAHSFQKTLVSNVDSKGYSYIAFRLNGKIAKCYIHRLQAYQKYGDKIYHEGMQVRHLNGDCRDNSFENIVIGTAKENSFDKPKETRKRAAFIASRAKPVKYSDEQVREMKRLHSEGFSYKYIMDKFCITSKGQMSFLMNKRIYDNLPIVKKNEK